MNGRVARGAHTAEATRILPLRRGEKPCPKPHDIESIRNRQPCPSCKAVI